MTGLCSSRICRGLRIPSGDSSRDHESGVSEVVGSILLISIVVLAVSIVGVILMSQPTPGKIPSVNFMVGMDDKMPPTLYLYHNGGDTLQEGDFSVLVDGVAMPYSISGGGSEWSLGKNLVIPLNTGGSAKNIVLVYNNAGSGPVVLRSASANVSTIPQNIYPDRIVPVYAPAVCINGSNPAEVVTFMLGNVSLIADAMNQSPSTVGPVIADVAGAHSVNFYKSGEKSGAAYIVPGTYFRFRVTSSTPPSAVTYIKGSTVTSAPLAMGDIVMVTLDGNAQQNFKTFGIGDQLWELSAQSTNLTIRYQNGTAMTCGGCDISHAWISRYTDMSSTLSIDGNGDSGTSLIVNFTQYISGQNSDHVQVSNIRPIGLGLFLIEEDSNKKSVYFIGQAREIRINGVIRKLGV